MTSHRNRVSLNSGASALWVEAGTDKEYFQQLRVQHGSPLLILDREVVRQQYRQLTAALPSVDLYFAIKAQPYPAIIHTLDELGAGFDIATSGEIALLKNAGVEPQRCIHTHPIKRDKDIQDSLRYGCTSFVFDNLVELEKFTPYRSRVGLILRVSFPNPGSPIDLSRKFGCRPEEVAELLHEASQRGIHVKGLSFHAGSQCRDANNHVRAIEKCLDIMREYNQTHDKNMFLLDIGGGFPVPYSGDDIPSIDEFCKPIVEALSDIPDYVHVIAEPGRYLVAPAGTALVSVIGKAMRGDQAWYYLDDGVYDLFSGKLFDHAAYPLTVFIEEADASLKASTLAGPTCDSIDVIVEDLPLPDLAVGDFIVASQMGAYTNATATDFNLFPRAAVLVR